MIKKVLLILGLTAVVILATCRVSVKADMITATNQIPNYKALYHVNDAEVNLQNKVNTLNALLASGAGACDVARAQAEVNEASLLLNNLNLMVSHDIMLIGALPAPDSCSTACMTQALTAQAAWTDYLNKTKANQAALSSTYASQIIASNQYALINQAALAHRYSTSVCNPVTAQATANWAMLNKVTSDQNSYAMGITNR